MPVVLMPLPMSMPRSSSLCIVVPVLNEAQGIEATLQSLTPLRQRGARVVVVDGGSQDDTQALAQAHADAVIAGPRGRAGPACPDPHRQGHGGRPHPWPERRR